ncbi:C4-dicarboxylate ABC transporter [Pseudooceanicola lipolyticus]|uniref:TRAP transporter large permease protein n=1 Tax=Pseudooceanicola lipolyticus TaxID=2029104 RepID=A0A2M8J5K3_9RHOB|nr:TRAP transporter large permease subunit [Pseudooceanicola lipolyticus]PJE38059.1 C4-dicarboxylate ABC transporter [Pseudooceanicola lipolyticus]
MTDIQIGFAGIAILLTLIALRVPIGVSLIGVSFAGIWVLVGERAAFGSLGIIPYNMAATWQLSSVPMFLLMGFFSFHAGLTKGLFDAARVWLSGLPGGLAIASVFGAAGFAAVTGSSVACAAAMGRIAVPEMMRREYDTSLATGTVAAAGTIGALIPPSILMIMYGIIAEVPINQLFLGGVGAGIMTAVGYVAVIMTRATLKPELAPRMTEVVPLSERIAALKEIWPVLLLVVCVFGGLFGGVFTPTEAGAVGAFVSVVIAGVKGLLTLKKFRDALLETLLTSGALFIIAIGASMLTRFLAFSGAGDYLSEMIVGIGANEILLLIAISLIYLVLGMFLEPLGAMLLTLPILLPIIESTNFSLVWFGIVLTKFLEIGMITPPIGLNVFVIKGVVGNLASTSTIFRGVLWFLFADLIVVVLLIMFPEITLYLPRVLG